MNAEHRDRLPVSVSAAVYIEDKEGRLLLLRQASETKGRKWGPPAGGALAHEDPFMTAVRETKEEIDVDIELVDVLGIYPIDRGDTASGISFVFRAKISKGEIKPNPGEIMEWGYFSREELKKMIGNEQIYNPEYNIRAIEDWIAGNSYPLGVIKPLE